MGNPWFLCRNWLDRWIRKPNISYSLYNFCLYRRPRDPTLSRYVTMCKTLTTEQWIDVQGHSRSTTFVAIESHFLLVINCHLSSISHRFRDTSSRSRKPHHPSLSPRSRRPPSNLAVKLMLKANTLCYFYVKKRNLNFSRFVTIHSRYRQTTDRQYIMTISGHCNKIATFGQKVCKNVHRKVESSITLRRYRAAVI